MSVAFTRGKKLRDVLRLPQLHYIACDDWMDKIGEDAFCAWLRFITWADRSQEDRDSDKIPSSMNAVAKRLGISKATFYKNVIRPLWDYGFIDLEESECKGNLKENPINIIIYDFPQNNAELVTKPLEKVRDYETEYKPKERKEKSDRMKNSSSKNEPGDSAASSSKNEPDSSLKNEPGPSSKIEQNNSFKNNNVLKNNDIYIPPSESLRSKPKSKTKKDELPPWVANQTNGKTQNVQASQLSPEQQAEAERLLRQLGEL